ncbi:MAG: type III-B CRISPR-associated protein Cas10/Cmr2 [Bacteroidota bacterium]
MKTYLAFTIGPIYKTLLKARKTREIWISSYLFSYLMRILLIEIQKKKIGKFLIPDLNLLKDYKTFHGAGVFNDRCIIELQNGKTFSESDFKDLSDQIIKLLSGTFTKKPSLLIKPLKNYLQIYGLIAKFDTEKLRQEKDPQDQSVIFKLNKMMDDLERQSVYHSSDENITKIIFENVTDFYTLGFNKDNVDIQNYQDIIKTTKGGKKVSVKIMSFPSVIEIAGKQLIPTSGQKYNEYENLIKQGLSYLVSEDKTQNEDIDDNSILDLLKKDNNSRYRTAHKYICIVNADGDNMGQCLGKIGNEWKKLEKFSKNLTDFSRKSADIIHEYGGHPIYIGGDDLFFLAPVLSTVDGIDQTIFELIKKLDTCFNEIWKKNKIPGVDVKTSMSYGLSITYYKYPLAEAINLSHHLLQDVAKMAPEKNAIAVQVMHHSGQYSKTVFEKNENASFDKFLSLLKEFPLKDTFINSVHDRIRNDKNLIELIGMDELIDFSGYFNNEYDIDSIKDHNRKNFIVQSINIFTSMFEEQKRTRLELEKKRKKDGVSDFSDIPQIKVEAMAQLDTIYRLLNFLIRTDND